MEEIEYNDPDQEFTDGVNNGYILAKNSPKILEQILWETETDKSQNARGIRWGAWLCENEKEQERLKELSKVREKGKEKDKDLDFDNIW